MNTMSGPANKPAPISTCAVLPSNQLPKTYSFVPKPACNMCGSERRILMGIRLSNSTGRNPRVAEGIAVPIKRCLDCGLAYPDPLPIPGSIEDHYGTPPESYWSEDYFKTDASEFAVEIEGISALLDMAPGMRSLDVGAGIGKGMIAAERAGFEAFGLEPSRPFHERAIGRMNIRPDRMLLTSLEEASFPANSFDYVSFGAVLEHLYDPAASIEKALGWLRPGGVIYAEVPHSRHSLSRLMNAYYRLRGTNYVTNCSPMHPPYHLYEFAVDSFIAHARRAGYEVADSRVDVGGVRHVPGFMKPLLRMWMDLNSTGLVLHVWLRRPLAV